MDWRRAGAGGGSVSAESQLQGAGRRGREQVMWHALYGGSRQQVAMGASGGVAAAAYLGEQPLTWLWQVKFGYSSCWQAKSSGQDGCCCGRCAQEVKFEVGPWQSIGTDWTGCSVDRLGGSSVHRLDPWSRVGRLAAVK